MILPIWFAYATMLVWSVLNAMHDAALISFGARPNHTFNGTMSCVLVLIFALACENWWILVPLLCIRAVIFELVLNYLRRLPINYHTGESGSGVDWVESKLFGKYAWAISNTLYIVGGVFVHFKFI